MSLKGVDIAWKNLNVVRPLSSAEIKERETQGKPLDPIPVLNTMSGMIKKGSFTTILGSSGSGKTTFLNFLSNRLHFLQGLQYTGQVYINGVEREKISFNSVAGYVMQEEVLLESLTVKETLMFSARFKMSRENSENRTKEVIAQLGLKSCENSLVGGISNKGISGGEKKRLSIGVELLIDPSIIFLDEPTTGLDSYNAEKLVELLNKLRTDTGITIIATLHQPNSYMYQSFDRIFLLGDNEVIYHGKASKALRYFAGIGFECPEHSNPSEFLLALVTSSEENYEQTIEKLKEAAVKKEQEIEVKDLPELFSREPVGFFKQLGLLIYRSSLNIIRNTGAIAFKSIANIYFILLLTAAYYKVCDEDDLNSVTDRSGIIFLIVFYICFSGGNGVISLSSDKALFMREQASHTYGPAAFYLSKLLFDIPFDHIIVLISTVLLYIVVGLDLEFEKITFFVGVILLADWGCRGIGNTVLIAMPTIEAATAMIPFVLTIQVLFAGVFLNFDSIPIFLKPFEYTSVFKYTWSACMINELDDYDEDHWDGCEPGGKHEDSNLCDPLDFYSIYIDKWMNVLYLFIISVTMHFFAYVLLALLAQKYRVN